MSGWVSLLAYGHWRKAMPLTGFQQEVLTGLMLGDGHLSIGGKAKNPRLRINRTDRDMEYAEWIAEVFSPYITAKSLRRTTQFDPRYEKTYGRVAFCSRRHPDFMDAYDAWYGSGSRRVPRTLRISPLTVAVWLADDGSVHQKMRGGFTSGIELKFNTSSFTAEGVEFLVGLLNARYDGGFAKYGNYKGKGQYVIMTSTRPAKRLLRDIDPVFPPQPKARRWREQLDISKTVPDCPACGEDAVFRNGFYYGTGTTRLAQRLRCRLCEHKWKVSV